MEVLKTINELHPRSCDCNYCQSNPSTIISDPGMIVELIGEQVSIRKNGDQLANFYYCSECDDLLAVGCSIGGQLRGAINSELLDETHKLGDLQLIQPWSLSADQKLDRWGKLWGILSGL